MITLFWLMVSLYVIVICFAAYVLRDYNKHRSGL